MRTATQTAVFFAAAGGLLFAAPGRGFAPPAFSAPPKPSTPVDAPRFWAYQVGRDGGIAAFSVAPNGDLLPLSFVNPIADYVPDAPAGKRQYQITLLKHPVLPVLYAVMPLHRPDTERGKPPRFTGYQVRVFGVAANGQLVLKQKTTIAQPIYAISFDGKWLYVPSGGGKLQIYAASASGTLQKVGGAAGITEGGGTDAYPQAGIGDNYALVFLPGGRIAFRIHHWNMLDSGGSDFRRFRVLPNGVLQALREPDNVLESEEWTRDNGDFVFSPDGRTALMMGKSGTAYVLSVTAWGQMRSGRAVVRGQTGPVWAHGDNAVFDRTKKFVLLIPSSYGLPNKTQSFRVGQITGIGKLRETARFGLPALINKKPLPLGTVSYSGDFRPDNGIAAEAAVFVPDTGKYVLYRALFRLLPTGAVELVKPWAEADAEKWEENPLPPPVFVETGRASNQKQR